MVALLGNRLSVVLANIYMAKLERYIVEPEKPIDNYGYVTKVSRNRKLPTHVFQKIFKRNTMDNDQHRSKIISSNFKNKLKEIQKKYNFVDYPRTFERNIIMWTTKGHLLKVTLKTSKKSKSQLKKLKQADENY